MNVCTLLCTQLRIVNNINVGLHYNHRWHIEVSRVHSLVANLFLVDFLLILVLRLSDCSHFSTSKNSVLFKPHNIRRPPSHWSIVLTDLFGICCTIALCFKLSIGAVLVDAASRSHKNDGSDLDFVCEDTCTGSLTQVLIHLSPLRFL